MTRSIFLAAVLVAAAPAASADGLLSFGGQKGTATVSRGDGRIPLTRETELTGLDLLTVAPDARLSLDISKHGFLELGGGAELSLERIPFATYADDLRTILRLGKGYLRLVWRHPALSTSWPMFVYMGNYRISLSSGEFFFENEQGKYSLCIGGGEAALTTPGAMEPVTLDGPACYRLIPGLAPQLVERDYQELDAARTNFALGTLADLMPAVAAAAPQADTRIPFTPKATPPPAPEPVRATAPAVAAVPSAAATMEVEVPRPVVVYAPVETLPAPKPRPATTVSPRVAPPQAAAPVNPPRKPTASVPAPAQTQTGGSWILNIASFPARVDAEVEARRLVDAGYAARITTAEIKGRIWYRVQLAGVGSVQQASDLAAELQQKLGIKNVWVIR